MYFVYKQQKKPKPFMLLGIALNHIQISNVRPLFKSL